MDLNAIVDRKDAIVEAIRRGSYRQVERNENLRLMEGEARFEGLDRTPYLTNRAALDLRELPESMIVVGGGYVGVEFAQMFARFGTRVTLIQRSDRLLPDEEPEIGEGLSGIFEDEGITVLTSSEVFELEPTPEGVRAHVRSGRGYSTLDAARVLQAAGRRPSTDGLGLDRAGVETDDRGFIRVDSRFRTTADGVVAIGDVTGQPMFTHSARDDADLQLVADNDTGRLLGGHVLGPSAGELIHEIALGLVMEATVADLGDAIHVHPTLSEGINAAAGACTSLPGE